MQANNKDKQLLLQAINGSIHGFFKQFSMGTLAYRCGMQKKRGVSVLTVLMVFFSMLFAKCNIYQFFKENSTTFQKDAVYSLLQSANISWRLFLQRLALAVISFLQSFQEENHDSVLIADTTLLERPRAKKVELCSRIYDYASKRYTKGFRVLALGFSVGHSFIPIDFAIFCAHKAASVLCGVTKDVNSRTSGGKRRSEAHISTIDSLCAMLRRAQAAGFKASHILMDSWFSAPDILCKISKYYPVICRAKKCSSIRYTLGKNEFTLNTLFRHIKKRPGKAKWLASAYVVAKNNLSLRIVYVRNKHNPKEWIALLTTDMHLPEEEILRLYGLRWEIEVFFRTMKQHLGFSNGVQVRDFDSIIANTTVVFTRYIFLSLEERKQKDTRTLGELFRACCKKLQQFSFIEALQRLFETSLGDLERAKVADTKVLEVVFHTLAAKALSIFCKQPLNCVKITEITG